jgi:hypothetical protein
MNYNTNKRVKIIMCFSILLLTYGCKKSKKAVDFELLPLNTGFVSVNPATDTVINNQHYYYHTFLVNTNFYRNACEDNAVKLSDVESIRLKASRVEIQSQSGKQFTAFSRVVQIFINTALEKDTIGTFQTTGISGNTATFVTSTDDLKKFFNENVITMPVFWAVADTSATDVEAKYELTFQVKGYRNE